MLQQNHAPYRIRNYVGLIIPVAFFVLLPLAILITMIVTSITHPENSANLLGYAIMLVLCFFSLELLWLSLIELEINNGTIIFRKPLKRFSVFRKKKTTWTIDDEEWDELLYSITKNGYSLYFRKERTATFFAAMEGGMILIEAIQQHFPNKVVIQIPGTDFPHDLRKRMKKEFPERFMRG